MNCISIIIKVVAFTVKNYTKHQGILMPVLRSMRFYFKRVRVSVAALLIIEKDGEYVLIKNHHREEYYAPIGGVFKHISETPRKLIDIEWSSDYTDHEPKKMDMKNDLRGIVPGKFLPMFIEWFLSRKDREGDQCILREIKEEMQEGRIGKSLREKSSDIKFKLNDTVFEGPFKTQEFDYDAQFRLFKIYTLDYSDAHTNSFADEIIKRAKNGDNNLILVTKKEINQRRTKDDKLLIAAHSKYFFSKKWHGVQPAKY